MNLAKNPRHINNKKPPKVLTIIIRNLQNKVLISSLGIKKAVLSTITLLQPGIKGEISICFVNDEKIKKFNRKYIGSNYPTDVIAFDISEEKNVLLSDILVSSDAAIRNAKTYETSPKYELYLYVVHGVLHLLGFDDKTVKERDLMQKKAETILLRLGLKNVNT
ncbi:MAG: rRNA maturation RNase YbeY [Candidatus Omnitrophica bacterium]|nr:rRNA maturation RNase YbeY [Candidatus Omnitrophota bacterium]